MLSLPLKNALLATPLCQYLEKKEIEFITQHNSIVTFAPGETILPQGGESPGIYIILQGIVLVSARILGEGRVNLANLNHGRFFGEINVIGLSPCLTSFTASSQVECLLITRKFLKAITLLHPEIKYKIMRVIAEGIVNHLQLAQVKISTMMAQSDMAQRSFFGEVIKSFTKPSPISFEEANINQGLLIKCLPFNYLNNQEYSELSQYMDLITASRHCEILQEGKENASCYVILKGAVQSSIIQDNKIAKLSILGPGSFFTGISLITSSSSCIINYTTCEKSILLRINEANMALLKERATPLWWKLFELICQSLVALEVSANKLDIRLNSESYNR
jgi:CRP/FNR family transcriptional regulator, cyclic AMP receptor protein